MGRVVSLGSINVDHMEYTSTEWVRSTAERYEWFPAPGETVSVGSVPDALRESYAETYLGGKGANQAVAAAAAGADAGLLGMVGDDEGRYDVLDSLSDRGVDVTGVARTDGPTGAAYIAVDETGENYIAILAGANGRVDDGYVADRLDACCAADCLLVQNELPPEAVRAALDRLADRPDRPTVVYDPAPAAGAAEILAHDCVDVVTPNEGEYDRLRGDIDAFEGTVVRTRGEDGVVVDGERTLSVAPPAVDPVDTTGAGDVFVGYLGAELAAGADFEAAVRLATVAGALSTEREGVQSAAPSREAVESVAVR
ncbi:PfkB family carbohydrate kinase [Halogeometricum sp. S1BR25-6]|uniref:Ribokinase n=1 Tax=Halogeometricum salsisoli TaxID=2950536 RepID=A0ABU2GJ78_9EURY|nr:PfkB family carbohydrate kinase [Halogeometricum sp. S1BR25-6]MDS0300855.1 PfkB family carbohydrate kinase [Halogeometricum sp. S1BR25-6]